MNNIHKCNEKILHVKKNQFKFIYSRFIVCIQNYDKIKN